MIVSQPHRHDARRQIGRQGRQELQRLPGDGVLEAFALTGRQWLLLGTVARGEAVALPPFDAVPFPLDSLFPFDDPAAPPSPSLET